MTNTIRPSLPQSPLPGSAMLQKVTVALDCLVAAAQPHHGLMPSVLDLQGRMLHSLPRAIPGQRENDRAFPGSNLMHDHSVLKTMLALAQALDRPDYSSAVDRYLQRFATHCTRPEVTPTGLFPWGEHAFWHLLEDRIGNSGFEERHNGERFDRKPRPLTHDHLLQAPHWLWEKLWAFNPGCVERFAEGLDLHYHSDERIEYSRHAPIMGPPDGQRAKTGGGPGEHSFDFPRHGGFYIYDWTFTLIHTGRDDLRATLREQITRMLDYWWAKRAPGDLVFLYSRDESTEADTERKLAMEQGLSLAVSVLESATMLESAEAEPELAQLMRERGAAYLNGFLAVPHDLAAGRFVVAFPLDRPDAMEHYAIWGSVYGRPPAAASGLLCLCAYRLTGNEAARHHAEAVGRAYCREPIAVGGAVPIKDAGTALELLVELADVTGATDWLTEAAALAEKLMPVYFDQAPLPRAAAGVDYYESQCLPGYFLHALARLAILRDGGAMASDYTVR